MQTQTWQEVDGDNTFAIDWPLNSHSLVCEVGAYEGRWAKQIMQKYNCTVHAFEPQSWAVGKLIMLQSEYPKLVIHPYALGNRDALLEMGEFGTDACSFLLPGQRISGIGEMKEAANVLASFGLRKNKVIDLMMMNIEGYEYELINYLIETGAIYNIRRLCVQWHTFADETGIKYEMLMGKLEIAHYTKLWSFFPTLEAYQR